MARGNRISTFSYSAFLVLSLLVLVTLAAAKPAVLTCTIPVGAKAGDTCSAIIKSSKLSAQDFSFLNPNLNCNKIFVGQWLCLGGGFVAY
ncbi:hypothetical protein LIER_33217 [Lithospermum erythrorhizon]|uniref:LysM domain-containing protein n=1 Tax=Lithospermum erythrorhizon TaxID=34254 RepID=A0AAV3RZS1_LITER